MNKRILFPVTYCRTHLAIEVKTPRSGTESYYLPAGDSRTTPAIARRWGFEAIRIGREWFIEESDLSSITYRMAYAFGMYYNHPNSRYHVVGRRSVRELIEISH